VIRFGYGLVLGFLVGGALALYFVCPELCKKGVKGGLAGFLHDKLGLGAGLSDTLTDLIPI
jgi:hypothetical protein